MKKKERHLNLDWASVRYRTVVLVLLTCVGMVAATWLVWSYYRGRYSPRALASHEIAVAERFYQEALDYDEEEGLKSVRDNAAAYLADAHRLYGEKRFDESRMKAFLSHNNSQKIIDSARSAGTSGSEVRFYRIDGDVKVRRAGNLVWEPADPDKPLGEGDAIKTAARSSAQMLYFDGSITTLKPESLVEITGLDSDPKTRQVTVTESLKVGGVRSAAFGSKMRGSTHAVATETTVARLQTASRGELEVDYDAQKKTTHVAVHAGEAAVSAGEKSLVLRSEERMQVDSTGHFGRKEKMLPAPRPLAPGDHRVLLREGKGHTPELIWTEVPKAVEYRVQVSGHPLMGDLAREITSGVTTVVKVRGLGDGMWYWRVAAVDSRRRIGSFSEVSRFRIADSHSAMLDNSRPPDLTVTEFLQTGSLVIISGKTSVDANLWVGHQKIDVYEDGSFTAVVRLSREGRNRLEIVAQDPSGQETVRRRDAYLEVF